MRRLHVIARVDVAGRRGEGGAGEEADAEGGELHVCCMFL